MITKRILRDELLKTWLLLFGMVLAVPDRFSRQMGIGTLRVRWFAS